MNFSKRLLIGFSSLILTSVAIAAGNAQPDRLALAIPQIQSNPPTLNEPVDGMAQVIYHSPPVIHGPTYFSALRDYDTQRARRQLSPVDGRPAFQLDRKSH